MNYSTALGLTAHLDQVLFPTPGPLHPNQILSNLDHYRMYDSWIALHREGRATVRLQMNFLHNQADPALPELHERLRNSFQFFGDDMLHTGSIGEWAAPLGAGRVARRAAAGGAGRLAQREQRAEPGGAAAGGGELGGGQQGVPDRDKRWCVHHVPEVTPELLTRLKNLGCGVQMAAFRWVTSAIRRWSSARRSAPSSITASRWASTATACTSRRSTRGRTSPTRSPASTRSASRSTPASTSRAPRRCASSRAATPGSCGWKTRSARSRRASWRTWWCSIATTSRCRTADQQIRSVLTIVDGRIVHGTLG